MNNLSGKVIVCKKTKAEVMIMSMPKFPVVPDLTLEDSIIQIISSIAMEELALSHIINTEGEKLQYVLGTLETRSTANRAAAPVPPVSIDDLLKVNDSVKDMLGAVSMNQMFLLGKLSAAMNAYTKLKDGQSDDADADYDDSDDIDDSDDSGSDRSSMVVSQ
jgi:hypothetical protein